MLVAALVVGLPLCVWYFDGRVYSEKPWGSSADLCQRVTAMAQAADGTMELYLDRRKVKTFPREAVLSLFHESRLTPCWVWAKFGWQHIIHLSGGGDEAHIYVHARRKAEGIWILREGDSCYVATAPDLEALRE